MKTFIVGITYLLIGLVVDCSTGSNWRRINWAVVGLWPLMFISYIASLINEQLDKKLKTKGK